MGFVGISDRFLELLELGPVDFDIRSSVCSLLFVCGLGYAGCHLNIVWRQDFGTPRSVVGGRFCGVGSFVVCSCYFHGLGTVLSTPGVTGTRLGF